MLVDRAGFVDPRDFVASYEAYLKYEEILRRENTKCLRKLWEEIAESGITITEFEVNLKEQADHWIISREKFVAAIRAMDIGVETYELNRIVEILDIQ